MAVTLDSLFEQNGVLRHSARSVAPTPASAMSPVTALLSFARRASDLPQKTLLVREGLEILRETLAADVAVFTEIVDGGSRIASYVESGVEDQVPAALQTLATEDSMAAYALATARPVLIENMNSEVRFNDTILRSLGITSGFAVPIQLATNPIGVVGVYRRECRRFSSDAREFAEVIGHLLLLALVQAEAKEELIKQRRSAVIDSTANAISALLNENDVAKGERDLRSSPRKQFEAEQLIAPLWSGGTPSDQDFRVVHCRDISAGGLAFLIDERPTYQKIMVALGRIPKIIYLTADIVRVTPTAVDGHRQFIVGCHFTGRCQF